MQMNNLSSTNDTTSLLTNQIEKMEIFKEIPLAMKRKCLSMIRKKNNSEHLTIDSMLPIDITVGQFALCYVFEHHMKRNRANLRNVQNRKKKATLRSTVKLPKN